MANITTVPPCWCPGPSPTDDWADYDCHKHSRRDAELQNARVRCMVKHDILMCYLLSTWLTWYDADAGTAGNSDAASNMPVRAVVPPPQRPTSSVACEACLHCNTLINKFTNRKTFCKHFGIHYPRCTSTLYTKLTVWTLVIALLTWVRLVTSSALQSRMWQLIGMSHWYRCTVAVHCPR